MMTQQGVTQEKFADSLNTAFKELIRRQTNTKQEFHKLTQEFAPIIEKTNETKTYTPLLNMFNLFNEWMLNRIEKAIQLTEMIITKKKTLQQIHAKEKNIVIEILKLDNLKLNNLKQEFFTYKNFLRVDWQKDILEYQLLNQCCLEYQIDYPQLLEAILKINDDSKKLMRYFESQDKPKGFLYEFFLKYAKKKIINYEHTLFMAEHIKKFLILIERNCNSSINMLQDDHNILSEQYLVEIQQIIRFHIQIMGEIKQIILRIQKFMAQNHKQLQYKYTIYMQLILEIQDSTKKKTFHDSLIENMSIQFAKMIQLNVLRDLSFNIFIVDLSSLSFNKLDILNQQLNNLLKSSIKSFDQSKYLIKIIFIDSRQNQQMYRNGELKWNDFVQEQNRIREQQLVEYKRILLQRKNHYLGDPNRYCNHEDNQPLNPLVLPLSAKECFKLFFQNSEQNFFLQFRTQILKQIQVKYSQFQPDPPTCYLNEECLDMKSLIDQGKACRRVLIYKEQTSTNIFTLTTSDYLDCKQEEFVFFISDQEFMVEQELFFLNQFNTDYFTLRKYLHFKEVDNYKTEIIYGWYKNTVKFSMFSLVDFRFSRNDKEIWEGQLKDAMTKYAIEYAQLRDNVKEERKQQFILNENMDFVLTHHHEGFLQEIPIIKQMIPKNTSQQWNLQTLIKQDTVVKFIFIILLFYYFRGTNGMSMLKAN